MTTISVRVICLCVCLGVFLFAGCGRRQEANQTAKPRPHVILISVDTLRADHLGCYGYARDTSPNIARRTTTTGRVVLLLRARPVPAVGALPEDRPQRTDHP